jgi:hypothetical protein
MSVNELKKVFERDNRKPSSSSISTTFNSSNVTKSTKTSTISPQTSIEKITPSNRPSSSQGIPTPPPKPPELLRLLSRKSTLKIPKKPTVSPPSLPKKDIRSCILQEWLSTEIQYVEDLNLILTYFLKPLQENPSSHSILSSFEQNILFSNVEQVHDLASHLLERWKQANEKEKNSLILCQSFMSIFLSKEVYLIEIYGHYCRNHDATMNMLTNLTTEKSEGLKWLQSQESLIKDKTFSWNLASLLIKPVQRILKYPLLIQVSPFSIYSIIFYHDPS